VVDDDYPLRTLLCVCLTAEGYQVATASNPADARKVIDDKEPDVVLLDLMLSRDSGLELAKEIGRDRPVIAMSASSLLLRQARELDCVTDTVAKPFEWDTLIEEIETI
jgi:DNA-binding response OmpR family regulator